MTLSFLFTPYSTPSMKKTLLHRSRHRWLMRLTLLPFLLLTSLVGTLLAEPVRGQNPLKRTVSLSMANQPIETILERLEKIVDVQFAYSYELIRADRRASLNARNERLEKVLNDLLNPLQIDYAVTGSRLIILRPKAGEAGLAPATDFRASVAPDAPASVDRTITGTVVDANNQPIPGVNLVVKGTRTGTSTDAQGNFRIAVADDQAVLQFSSVGYLGQEVPVGSRSTLTVTLVEDNKSLSEVVVVGYGTQKKSDLTGAVSTVTAKDIDRLPVAGIDQALQGKSSGVRVTQATGAPGEGVSVRIRGVGTINDNSPLFIIDGVPTKDAFSVLNPADIESMSVLKDASSAAIYGARAANGVIVVTTKRGKTGAPRVTLNAYSGVQQHGRLIPMANAQEYISIYNEAATNDNATITNPSLQRPLIPTSLQVPDTDWQQAIFRPAPIQNYQLSISGGTERSHYLISGNYFDQQGIILNSGYKRYALRTSVDTEIARKVKIGTNLNITYSQRSIVGSSGDGYGGNGGSIVRYALFHTPATPIYDQNGDYADLPQFPAFFGDGYNPVGLAEKQDNKEQQYRVFGDIFGEWQILKNLRFRTAGGLDLNIVNRKTFNENWGTNNRINSPSTLVNRFSPASTVTWNNTLNYNLTLGTDHQINALAGTEAIRSVSRDIGGSDRNFIDQVANLRYLGQGADITGRQSFEGDSRWALFSLFGRVNYAYKDKYLASVNVRRDGSSRFSPSNRYANFYSGSVGWNIDREAFFQPLAQTISQLKLRASIGQLGNQDIGNYPYASLIGSGYNYVLGASPQPVAGYAVVSRGNTNVKWESSTQADIGLEIGVLQNKLQLTADYFVKQTSDILVPIPVPRSGGSAAAPYVNAGKVENRGLELDLIYRDKKGDFSYDITANASFIRNKVLSLSDGRPIPGGRIDNGVFATLTEPGHPIGSFYLLQQDGIFQNEGQIFTRAFQGNTIRPGDVRFVDTNGDGLITQLDRSHVGSPIPTLTYGLTANLQWKNFDLSAFFQGVSGNKIYYQVATDIEGFYRAFNVTKRVVDGRWRGEGTSNSQPRVSWSGSANNKQPSTRFLEDGAYTRLKNLQIGYNLPATLAKKFGSTGLRVYLSGQNLFTLTKYPGLDPEQQSSDNLNNEQFRGDVAVGIDWGTYPSARIYTAGLTVSF
ncbi:SusC/RagA family TonB-linked outer membrane protein [Spirosoma sordidisoli]|uniref:SusC/RagA family TonB-linked outer membrane protein n=2 Tax=Spirosoma sordidisoli TaxID=2502893 RepID=A0A4Q2UQ94_9BACT|nr:SusC/RagA family TonB-linked outer membrane protein [Spirosoma sordidisoli]